jgi:hypothetical protein
MSNVGGRRTERGGAPVERGRGTGAERRCGAGVDSRHRTGVMSDIGLVSASDLLSMSRPAGAPGRPVSGRILLGIDGRERPCPRIRRSGANRGARAA